MVEFKNKILSRIDFNSDVVKDGILIHPLSNII